jgi:hypothetical protein
MGIFRGSRCRRAGAWSGPRNCVRLDRTGLSGYFQCDWRIFEIGVQRTSGSVSTVVCPNSEFLKQDLRGKHSWLNAFSAKELSERVRHVLSACSESPLTTSVCILTRQSMPIDMSLLKDFR